MPIISDTASAIKKRFGFHDFAASESSIRSPPDLLLKSASRVNPGHSSTATSVIRSMVDRDNGETASTGSAQPPRSQSFEFHEDPSFWKDHNVQVIIRIRPLNGSEISLQGYSKCIRQESCQSITWTGHPESRFTFDLVADENISQEKLFNVAALPMVENCVAGYNSCMFAYGQTGSGKTHTMLGDIEGGTHNVNRGMTPRVFEYLFSRIQKEKETRKDEKLRFTCKCSFLEIYNEQILDLLDPSANNLQLREDNKKGVYVENLKENEVTSARDVIQQLIQGSANRKVAATNMNRASSRSHSVFTCIIESKWESQGVTHHRFARLNLVDLAGSERQKSSGAEGERLKEATNINKSLSTLGLVIMNLVNISNGKSLHVPYRDSKLTFLLQDSLGGNSKTIIIANISPSTCCSLETLSTLKFAQRAKFIKNNAIVNEDASGDVIAMRMQIQHLKKEVSRLQGLMNGGAENLDNDSLAITIPGSPGTFKWEGLYGSFSPLTSNKKMSQKKDYEVALVGAFKREKEKEIALQTLAAENQAALQLAKQREDEIQGLKMRLRFREAGIKRLEAVASGKLSAESHFLKEKEEYLKEIEVLRTQADRNQEVTRFAMENLRLKEEIRRLKSFYEEGEQEMMNEQIKVLENKLLEALDWKLMHESDSSLDNINMVKEGHAVCNVHPNEEPVTPWRSSINDENEFLRMQAIHNQAEMDTLQKTLSFCLEEKAKLEKQVGDLVKELEEERSLKARKEEMQQIRLDSSCTNEPSINFNDQIELKTMVDAIATASQREAEAHETAIKLSKENDELRLKLKVLIEDNNKLIELYEQAAAESNYRNSSKIESTAENGTEGHANGGMGEYLESKDVEAKKVIANLEQQLMEINEENEKLMGLYEKAMQERDQFKRMLSSSELNAAYNREFEFPEKLVEVDEGEHLKIDKSPFGIYAKDSMEESHLAGLNVHDDCENPKLKEAAVPREAVSNLDEQDMSDISLDNGEVNKENRIGCQEIISENKRELMESILPDDANISIQEIGFSGTNVDVCLGNCHGDDPVAEEYENAFAISNMEMKPSNLSAAKAIEDLNMVRMKLERAEEKLLDSAKNIAIFGSLEKVFAQIDMLSREIEEMENGIEEKQQQFGSLRLLSEEVKSRKSLIDKKLSALKYSASCFASSVAYFEQREVRATARVKTSSCHVDQKKEDLARLKTYRSELDVAMGKIQQSEVELRNNLLLLKSKLEEENRRQDNEKVLFAIDNIEKQEDPSHKNWQVTGKATELLKSEEEKVKLQNEMKLSREKLGIIKKEFEDLKKKFTNVESDLQTVTVDIQKGSRSLVEMEHALEVVIQEKETLYEMREKGKTEIESMILEYQQHVFEADLREAELKFLEHELQMEVRRVQELHEERAGAAKKATKLLEETRLKSCCLSEKMEKELQSVWTSVQEAKSLVQAAL